MVRRDGTTLWLPALTTAHSHAFQFAMRGTAQRRGPDPKDDFWTWRGQMYRAAMALTPESIVSVSRAERRARRAFFLAQGLNAETTELLTSRSRDLSSDLALVRSDQLPLAPDPAAGAHPAWPQRRKRPFIRLVHPPEAKPSQDSGERSSDPQD